MLSQIMRAHPRKTPTPPTTKPSSSTPTASTSRRPRDSSDWRYSSKRSGSSSGISTRAPHLCCPASAMFGLAVTGGRSLCGERPRCAWCAPPPALSAAPGWHARALAVAPPPRAQSPPPISLRCPVGETLGRCAWQVRLHSTSESGPLLFSSSGEASSLFSRDAAAACDRAPACCPSLLPCSPVCGAGVHAGASISVRGSSPRRVPFSFFFRTVARIVTALKKISKNTPGSALIEV